ncbi:hypothetical protein GCM10010429_25090 [Micromonospora olivasterospora]
MGRAGADDDQNRLRRGVPADPGRLYDRNLSCVASALSIAGSTGMSDSPCRLTSTAKGTPPTSSSGDRRYRRGAAHGDQAGAVDPPNR